MSPDEIIAEFPQLGLADVHASLAYYHDNQQLIDRQIQESCELVARMKARGSDTADGNG